jgi:hypothetical protein
MFLVMMGEDVGYIRVHEGHRDGEYALQPEGSCRRGRVQARPVAYAMSSYTFPKVEV